MAKRKKAKVKKTKMEPTIAQCLKNLAMVHALQGAWLSELKQLMRSEKRIGDD